MDKIAVIDERIVEVINILEHIRDLDKMIALHKSNKDSFMLEQYQHRRIRFVKELRNKLEILNISPAELAAA